MGTENKTTQIDTVACGLITENQTKKFPLLHSCVLMEAENQTNIDICICGYVYVYEKKMCIE